MARERREDLAWDYTDTTGNDELFENSPLLRNHRGRNFQSFAGSVRRPLQREDLLLLIESLETSSSVLRAALEDVDYSEPPSPLSGSQARLNEERWYSSILRSRGRRVLGRVLTWILRYHFIMTVAIQGLNIGVISILDKLPGTRQENETYIKVSTGILISLEVMSLLIIVIATVYLSRQMLKNTVSPWFLAQVYVATILVFAGLYTATYKLNHQSWKDIGEPILKDPVLIIDLFIRMFHLSVSTATLCGSCVITPRVWYNYFFVCTQMLLSFVYFAQILAQSMHAGSLVPFVQRQRSASQTRRTYDDQSSIHTEIEQDDTASLHEADN